MSNDDQTWFADALKFVMAQRTWNQTQLAQYLGVDRQAVNKYLGGMMPSAERIAPLIKKLGGDITRALPFWKPPVAASSQILQENERLKTRVTQLETHLEKLVEASALMLKTREKKVTATRSSKPLAKRRTQ